MGTFIWRNNNKNMIRSSTSRFDNEDHIPVFWRIPYMQRSHSDIYHLGIQVGR